MRGCGGRAKSALLPRRGYADVPFVVRLTHVDPPIDHKTRYSLTSSSDQRHLSLSLMRSCAVLLDFRILFDLLVLVTVGSCQNFVKNEKSHAESAINQ